MEQNDDQKFYYSIIDKLKNEIIEFDKFNTSSLATKILKYKDNNFSVDQCFEDIKSYLINNGALPC